MKTIILTDHRRGTGKSFLFKCQDIIEAIPIDPVLPKGFEHRANDSRPPKEMAWWGVPFVQTYRDDDPEFVKHWNGNRRYDLRCLDGGAWDRSTNWGCFGKIEEAIAEAKRRTRGAAEAALKELMNTPPNVCISCGSVFVTDEHSKSYICCQKCLDDCNKKDGRP